MTANSTTKLSSSPTDQVKSDNAAPVMVTLEQLANELKISPRDARMLLRLAAKQTRQYPDLGKDHVARQPWQWRVGSRALEDARKALTQPQ